MALNIPYMWNTYGICMEYLWHILGHIYGDLNMLYVSQAKDRGNVFFDTYFTSLFLCRQIYDCIKITFAGLSII